jgi:hypothetical protein
MSKEISIDLVYFDKICSMKNFPKTIQNLQNLTRKFFQINRCVFRYVDEEGELVTISSDKELQETYLMLVELDVNNFTIVIDKGHMNGCYSQKIQQNDEKVLWEDVKCSKCNDFVNGIRFKCTICEDLNCCEFCEMTMQHEHPFIKFENKDQYTMLEESGFIILDKSSVFQKSKQVK